MKRLTSGVDLATSPLFLVERYLPLLSPADLQASVAREAEATAELAGRGIHIARRWEVYVPVDELYLCLFEAPSREAVEQACVEAQMPADRIVEAVALAEDRGRRRKP